MNRYVVMVDAGYLLHQAVQIVSSKVGNRRNLEISDPEGLIWTLLEKSKATLDLAGKELLRVYWYDGVMANGLTPQQRSLVSVNDVQLRAGTINGKGRQKGVDSLIVTDLIELTSHHAICDAVLVTGDSDLAVAIEVAQKRGVRIAVLGVENVAAGVLHGQSFQITSRADRVGMLGQAELSQVFRYVPSQQAPEQQPVAVVASQTQAVSGQIAAPTDQPRPEQQPAAVAASQTQAASGQIAVPTDQPRSEQQPAAVAASQTQAASGQIAAPTDQPRPEQQPAAVAASQTQAASSQIAAPTDRLRIEAAIKAFIAQQATPLAGVVDHTTKRIDPAIDRLLLHHVFTELGHGRLTNDEKVYVRQVFRAEML